MDKNYIVQKRKEAAIAVRTFKSNREEGRKEDGDDIGFNGATFLYIRAYDGDTGIRPISSGNIYWLSPDIEIYKDGVLVDTAFPLQPGIGYTVRVTVRNDGDMDCSSCITDLFITHPTIGFSVNNMSRIGLTSGLVPAHSFKDFDFPFIAVEDMCGHKCLFARAYSLSSNDFPEDWDNFYSYYDRHIAQQNINVVREEETVGFNVEIGRIPTARLFDIRVNKHTKNFIKDKSINRKFSINTMKTVPFEAFEIKKLEQRGKIIKNKVPSLIPRDVKRVDKTLWRESLAAGKNKMNLKIPILGLKSGEAVPIEVLVNDPDTGKVIGGITWLVIK